MTIDQLKKIEKFKGKNISTNDNLVLRNWATISVYLSSSWQLIEARWSLPYYETFLPPIIKDEIRNLTVSRQVIFVMFNLKMIVWEITQPPKILFIKKYHLCKIVPDIRHYNWCKSRLYDYKPGPDSLCCSYSYNPSHKYHSHKLSKETP